MVSAQSANRDPVNKTKYTKAYRYLPCFPFVDSRLDWSFNVNSYRGCERRENGEYR